MKNFIKNANTLLLTNHLKVQNKDYTVASEINMSSFKNEINLISKRYHIQVNGIDGTEIYQVGKNISILNP